MPTLDLRTPFGEETVRKLRAGDFVSLSGRIVTGRDAVHKFLNAGGEAPCRLHDAVIYHCGPIVVRENGIWKITAAGPTTSIREEPYMPHLIKRFHLRGIIGKGGMGTDTMLACRRYGCVYFHAVGGAAQVLAETIVSVNGVYLSERFGQPEAIWDLQVRNVPLMVTIDAHGTSLHEDVARKSRKALERLLAASANADQDT